MMEFPALVYRTPGPYQRTGGTYDYRGVTNHDELKECLRAGWYSSLPEAMERRHAIDESALDTATDVADDAAPTREELEAKARELGIKFDGRTGDKKLLERITEALEG